MSIDWKTGKKKNNFKSNREFRRFFCK